MAEVDSSRALPRVKQELRRIGMLPFTDTKSPSVVSIVAGGPVSGSWWGHPAGHSIYEVGEALESDPEVLFVRLWRGKRTLVHRRLWSALVQVGQSRTGWQMAGLSGVARQLLKQVDHEGRVRNDRLPPDFAPGTLGFRPALRELERRLLVLTRSVHTRTGAHALEAESWAAWRARVRVRTTSGSVRAAQLLLENAARPLSPQVEPRHLLPWGRLGKP